MKKILVVFVVYLCISNLVFADEIVTVSGNRYEGKIVEITEEVVEIETEDSFVEIERDKIETIIKDDGTVITNNQKIKPEAERNEDENTIERPYRSVVKEKVEIEREPENLNTNEALISLIEKKLNIESHGTIEERVTIIENRILGVTYIDDIDFRVKRLLEYLELEKAENPVKVTGKAEPVTIECDVDSQQEVSYPKVKFNDKRNNCTLGFNYVPMHGDYLMTPTTVKMMKHRWQKCPVTVSLYGVPAEHLDKVKMAIEKWSKYIPLKEVETSKADVVFNWVKKRDLKKVTTSQRSVGVAQHEFIDAHVCTIFILDQRKYPKTQLEHTIMHELGHAFGLGHSNNKKDLMYPINSAMKGGVSQFLITNVSFIPIIIPTRFRKATQASLDITVRDANTLWQIYNPGGQTWRD